MKYLSQSEALETFELLFHSAQHEMFKAEVLQDYTAVDDSPSLRAWLAGDTTKARELGQIDKDILAYRNKCLESPAKITRVHIVETPYTKYLNWEIAVCYKDSLAAHGAESIYLVEADQLEGAHLPAGDFWIFDGARVLQWEYENGVGKTSGAQVWDKAYGDNIEAFLELSTYIGSKASLLA